MTDLECLIVWLKTYDGYDILGSCQVDYTDQIPNQGFVFPQGLVEVERREDILGNVTLTDRYNFGLYFTFEKALQDDTAARANASWVMDFQRWVQEQSAAGLCRTLAIPKLKPPRRPRTVHCTAPRTAAPRCTWQCFPSHSSEKLKIEVN